MHTHLTNVDATRILRSRLGMKGPFSINDEDYARMVHAAMMREPIAVRECYTHLLATLASGDEAAIHAAQLVIPEKPFIMACAEPSSSDFILALLSLPPAVRCILAATALTRSLTRPASTIEEASCHPVRIH